MSKEMVGGRVPGEVVEELDEYAEEWNLSRTEAMTGLLRVALEVDPVGSPFREGVGTGYVGDSVQAFSVPLGPDEALTLSEMAENSGYSEEVYLANLLRQHVGPLDEPDW